MGPTPRSASGFAALEGGFSLALRPSFALGTALAMGVSFAVAFAFASAHTLSLTLRSSLLLLGGFSLAGTSTVAETATLISSGLPLLFPGPASFNGSFLHQLYLVKFSLRGQHFIFLTVKSCIWRLT